MDVVVEGNCFLAGRFERCCLGIEQGRIVRIAKVLEADKVYRFEGKMILPGAIDAHVHFRDPGMTKKEDFGTGSMAAIHGGVTCVLDMPNTNPPTVTVSSLRDKKKLAMSKSWCDFGLFAGVRPGVDVQGLAKDAIGFKIYMAGTTGDLLVSSVDQVAGEFAAIAATNKVLAVHAEDDRLRKKEPEKSLEEHLRNRNNECEASAIRKIVEAAAGLKLHICHVSAKESIPLVAQEGPVTSEVTPHHLLLDKDMKLGALGKVNPPLRRREDRQALFMALKDGIFDIIASDHAPHTMDEKQEDFEYAPSGMPGTETMVPLMLHLAKEDNIPLRDVCRMLCQRPGEIFGMKKGLIAEGYEADLMVVDMDSSTAIKADKLNSKCGWTAFEGMQAIFPKIVFLRGEAIMEDGNIVGECSGRDIVERPATE